jgi:hypothetical protein
MSSVPEAELLAELEAAPVVFCAKYSTFGGGPYTTLATWDSQKAKRCDFDEVNYDAIQAYCEAHPDKWAWTDGCCVHWPRQDES